MPYQLQPLTDTAAARFNLTPEKAAASLKNALDTAAAQGRAHWEPDNIPARIGKKALLIMGEEYPEQTHHTEQQIRKLSKRIDTLNAELAALTGQRHAAIQKGRLQGITVKRLAQISGLSENQAHNIVNREPRGPR